MGNMGVDPGMRDSASLVFYQGRLYLHGNSAFSPGLSANATLFYDFTGQKWQVVATTGTYTLTAYHSAHIYKDAMYVLFGENATASSDEVYALNLTTLNWAYVGRTSNIFLLFYSYFQISSQVYVVFGREQTKIYNWILKIDLSQPFITAETVLSNAEFPPRRKGHCMFSVYQYIVVFGGLGENSIYFNDLWVMDVEKGLWSQLSIYGDVPSPRAEASCTETFGNFFLVGGMSSSAIYADGYMFNLRNQQWTLIMDSTDTNSGRYGACTLGGWTNQYVIGGYDYLGLTNEIIVISYHTFEPQLATSIDNTNLAIAYQNCKIIPGADFDLIYILGGEGENLIPNNNYYLINISTSSPFPYKIAVLSTSANFSPSKNAVVWGSSQAFILFGSYYNTVASGAVSIVDVSALKIVGYKEFGVHMYAFAACLLQNRIYVFGGGDTADRIIRDNTVTGQLYKITSSETDPLQIPCGTGSYGPNCDFCPMGTYDNGNNSCVRCPKGMFSNFIGAPSMISCTICPNGTFNDMEGASYCKVCPAGYFCPVGVVSPILQSLGSDSVISSQPGSYQTEDGYISYISNVITYSLGGFLIVLLVFVLRVSPVAEIMRKIDIYAEKHPKKHEQEPGQTKLGGAISLFFIICALLIISTTFLAYDINNIAEAQTLIPFTLYGSTIAAPTVTLNFSFFIYGGECSYGNKLCFGNLKDENLNYSNRSYFCEYEATSTAGICHMNVEYTNFSVQYIGSLNVKMTESYSYAGVIQVNVSSDSSIPASLSQIQYTIVPDSRAEVFKGKVATTIPLKFTPAVRHMQLFQSQSSAWPAESQGYLISEYADPVKGTAVDGTG
jgi:hypothetical protein